MSAKFLYILGPTATGKSAIAMRLAQSLGWPIINCDSVQVYKGLKIGSAQPSAEDMNLVVHHLFDYVEAPKKQTAADYLNDLNSLLHEQKISQALFVGGSGFYVQAIEKGLISGGKVDEALKQEIELWIEAEGFGSLHRWIQEKDPVAVAKISENDHYRIRRAVELMKQNNSTLTELKEQLAQENQSILPTHKAMKVGVGMERDELRGRVRLRTQKMLEAGLVQETKDLVKSGGHSWWPLSSVGYKEVMMCLDGGLPESELVEQIVTSTMQLAKKQSTWFRRDMEIGWYSPESIDQLEQAVHDWSKNA